MALGGSGWIDVEGEQRRPGHRHARADRPAAKRKVHAGPEGLRMLVIGGAPGRAYEAPAMTELGAAS